MQGKPAVRITFGAPSPEQALPEEKESDSKTDITSELEQIRSAVVSGKTEEAVALIDQCLGREAQDAEEPQGLEEKIRQAYKK